IDSLQPYQSLPSFNIAPTHLHPVLTNEQPRQLRFFQWGLIPYWAKAPSIGSKLINARVETLLEKPAFRQAAQQRRCLVPFDGFYEWKKDHSGKQPYRICKKDESIFCVAGIWEKWMNPNGQAIFTFSLITQPPNQLLADIHNRMPAILLPEQENLWIDPKVSTKEALQLIAPYPDAALKAYPVSKRVNKVSENDASLLDEIKPGPIQGSLF
ncbi:MAG: SOS response-associated peptidase, partial [Bacteroidota bacterium]